MSRSGKVCLFLVIFLAAFLFMVVLSPQAAEASTARERAMEEVREAIRALPPSSQLTGADRAQVEAVVRMAEAAMAQYGFTYYDICTITVELARAEYAVGMRGAMADVAMPATGGMNLLIPVGLISILAGAAIIVPRKRG